METLSHLRPRRCEGVRNNTLSPLSVSAYTGESRVAGIAWNDDAFRFKSGRGSGKWVNDPALARRRSVTVPLPSSITYITSHQTSHHITSRWILCPVCPGEEPEDHWPDTSHCPIPVLPHSSTSAHLPNYFITFVLFCSYYINYVIQLFHCAFLFFSMGKKRYLGYHCPTSIFTIPN